MITPSAVSGIVIELVRLNPLPEDVDIVEYDVPLYQSSPAIETMSADFVPKNLNDSCAVCNVVALNSLELSSIL